MSRGQRVEFVCRHCGRPDTVKASQLRAYPTAGRFCSRACRVAHWRTHPEETPGRRRARIPGQTRDGAGYIMVRINGQRVRQHRAEMERLLERPLHLDEHVHHRNGNKADNRPENLELLTKSAHHQIHARRRILDKAALLLLHEQGFGRRRIARILGCGETTIVRELRRYAIPAHPPGSKGSPHDRRARVL